MTSPAPTPWDIRVTRLALGWTIARMAQHFGLNPRSVAAWEAGESVPSQVRREQIRELMEQVGND